MLTILHEWEHEHTSLALADIQVNFAMVHWNSLPKPPTGLFFFTKAKKIIQYDNHLLYKLGDI